jgi:hypothetical protein
LEVCKLARISLSTFDRAVASGRIKVCRIRSGTVAAGSRSPRSAAIRDVQFATSVA